VIFAGQMAQCDQMSESLHVERLRGPVLEAQLHQIAELGYERYLSMQMSEGIWWSDWTGT
jgi:hypothetical protein